MEVSLCGFSEAHSEHCLIRFNVAADIFNVHKIVSISDVVHPNDLFPCRLCLTSPPWASNSGGVAKSHSSVGEPVHRTTISPGHYGRVIRRKPLLGKKKA